MANNYQEIDTFNFETYVSIIFTYKKYPPRIEEGHGFHKFNEDEEISREVDSVKIFISDEEIDITSRLTEEEKSKILIVSI